MLIYLFLVRTRTSIRVPEVYAWSSDSANPVGAEYIIMDKIRGVTLVERWETMNTLERYKVIDRIVEMEKELKDIKSPAYGSLFLRDSLPHACHNHPLPPDLDPDELFCIGPSCSRAVLQNSSKDISQPDVGPCEFGSLYLDILIPNAIKERLSWSLRCPYHDVN